VFNFFCSAPPKSTHVDRIYPTSDFAAKDFSAFGNGGIYRLA